MTIMKGTPQPSVLVPLPLLLFGVRIVQTMAALPEGNVGEIWVTSRSRAAGYWAQPEKTAEDFGGVLASTGNVRARASLRVGNTPAPL